MTPEQLKRLQEIASPGGDTYYRPLSDHLAIRAVLARLATLEQERNAALAEAGARVKMMEKACKAVTEIKDTDDMSAMVRAVTLARAALGAPGAEKKEPHA